MTIKTGDLLVTAIGLATANLGFEFFDQSPNWLRALETSWFQSGALLAVFFVSLIRRDSKP